MSLQPSSVEEKSAAWRSLGECVVCPSCGGFTAQFDLEVGPYGHFNDPIVVTENGFRVFFRNFLQGQSHVGMVGVALAWRNSDEIRYGCIATKGAEAFSYQKGDQFPITDFDSLPNMLDSIEEFKRLKQEAVDKVIAFVSEVPHSSS